MPDKEDIDEKIKEFELAKTTMENIQDGGKIKRFAFTQTEKEAIIFCIDVLNQEINLFNEDTEEK